MIAVVHPTGNTFVRALLGALEDSKAEYRFFTTISSSKERVLSRMLPRRLRENCLRRSFGIPESRIETQPWREMVRLLAKRLNWTGLTTHESGWACVDAVYQALDRRVAGCLRADARRRFRAIHAYEDGALESFRAASEQGMLCSYELPIAYWETTRMLLQQEAERYPDWRATMVGALNSEAKLERKTEELELANLVICPSQFVRKTLPARIRGGKPCVVAPFGTPQRVPAIHADRPKRPFRVLFAGSMTQRKGLADLFAAMRLLRRKDVELIVMGSLMQPLEFYRARCKNFIYEEPRPHAGVLALMQSCDALVLPSIVEGRALVQQEAMSCGLPLIVTANAGGEDLIEEGRTGFLIPIRSPESIAERIDWMADHLSDLSKMAECARLKAESVNWSRYGEAILRALSRETGEAGEWVGPSASCFAA